MIVDYAAMPVNYVVFPSYSIGLLLVTVLCPEIQVCSMLDRFQLLTAMNRSLKYTGRDSPLLALLQK